MVVSAIRPPRGDSTQGGDSPLASLQVSPLARFFIPGDAERWLSSSNFGDLFAEARRGRPCGSEAKKKTIAICCPRKNKSRKKFQMASGISKCIWLRSPRPVLPPPRPRRSLRSVVDIGATAPSSAEWRIEQRKAQNRGREEDAMKKEKQSFFFVFFFGSRFGSFLSFFLSSTPTVSLSAKLRNNNNHQQQRFASYDFLSAGMGALAVTSYCVWRGQDPLTALSITAASTVTALVANELLVEAERKQQE